MIALMRTARLLAIGTFGGLSLIAVPAHAADCKLAIEQTEYLADLGRRAFDSWNYVQAAQFGGDARIPAIDASRLAKACGCKDAIEPLDDVVVTAQRANLAFNLDMGQQYAARIIKDSNLALAALQRCSTG
jgi:hypothetical protein